MGRIAHQRASRHPVIQTGHQLYETPVCATRALMRHEALPYRIWEPAAGRGAISRVLKERGHQVHSTDLIAYDGADHDVIGDEDFFDQAKPPNKHFECIVTNPPFKLADRFIQHALLLVPKVVVLLRLAALEGAGRAHLIDGHLHRLWVGIERLPMMHREGWQGPKIAGQAAPFAWFVFERKPADGFIGKRISWRQE